MQNSAWKYSIPWSKEKYKPNKIVNKREKLAFFIWLFKIAWWDQVTLTPEDNKIIVFNKGTFIGLKELIKWGGQICPISILGLNLLWKYPQKKETKKNTSEVINKIIPNFNPSITTEWCHPCNKDSRITSRHQVKAMNIKENNEQKKNNLDFSCIIIIKELVKEKIPTEHHKGQGLISIMWYLWNLLFINEFQWNIKKLKL